MTENRFALMLIRHGIKAAKRSLSLLADGDSKSANAIADGVRKVRKTFPALGVAYDRTLVTIIKRKFGNE